MTTAAIPLLGFDQNGRVFDAGDVVLRHVSDGYKNRVGELYRLYGANDLASKGVVDTTLRADGTLEHRKLPISYPYEWPASMYKDAVLFHLQLLSHLGKAGMTLKDALPNNILFDHTRPVFVDFLSLVRREQLADESWIHSTGYADDRFAVLDSRPGLVLFSTGQGDSIEEQRRNLDSTRGYAALYYPWLQVAPSGPGDPILVPPSGHVCGVFSRSDQQRGVHKAPANEIVAGALGVERSMSNIDQGQVNLQGINVIRTFSGGRPVLWGARTTATDTNWQYVNIRRLFLFLEESIQEGINWAVFEPNNLALWQKLKRTINEFLNRAWKDGALFGATAEEAYYTKIDATNNTSYTMALGELHIEIGVRPSYPAEFIVVHIGLWQGGAQINEL